VQRTGEVVSQWQRALREFARRLNEAGLPYKIVGSAAIALHSVPVAVQDVDVETDEGTVYLIQRLFPQYVVEEVRLVTGKMYRSHFGRLVIQDVVFELMGDLHRWENGTWVPTYTRTVDIVHIDGVPVPTSWLEEEVLAYIRRDRLDRAALCLPYCRRERLLALIRGHVQPGVV